MKLLLVQPCFDNNQIPTRLPAGLMALAAYLDDKVAMREFAEKMKYHLEDSHLNSINITIVDEHVMGTEHIVKLLKTEKFNIVGFTVVTPMLNKVLRYSNLVKKSFPGTTTIAGGAHITAQPIETIEMCKSLDLAVIGRGEETLAEIVIRYLLNICIYGIAGTFSKYECTENIKIREDVIKYGKRPFLSKALKYITIDKYYTFDVPTKLLIGRHSILQTSIGCPFDCSFCGSNIFNDKQKYFKLSAEEIFAEILYCYNNYNISSFIVVDDMFTISKERILKLKRMIIERKLKLKFIIMTRADFLDEEIIISLKEIGVVRCSIGVETGDQTLLNNIINKQLQLSKVEDISKIIKKYKIHLHYYIIVGLPTQDWQSIVKTIKFVIKNNPDSIATSIAIPYPGTALYHDPRIKMEGTKNWSVYYHEPEPQVKDSQFEISHTTTDKMSSEDIAFARYIVMSTFKNRSEVKFFGLGK